MAFAPSSNLSLCSVPFDITYKNQVRFSNKADQSAWFHAHRKYFFSEFLVIRKNKPGGGVQTSVKVPKNIDDLYGCNYLGYCNVNHGDKVFYGFITQLVYINENTTEILFETDVWQTWMFDIELRESFVVRETPATDEIGQHVVPEPFECNDYTYSYVKYFNETTQYGYLVALSNPWDSKYTGERSKLISGIYQGLYYYYFDNQFNDTKLDVFLHKLDIDSVQFITLVPRFCVSSDIGPTEANPDVSPYYVQESISPSISDKDTITVDFEVGTFEGYHPRNKKLYTSPFFNLIATDHAGQVMAYNVEEFDEITTTPDPMVIGVDFALVGDISGAPSVFAYPRFYKGLPHAVEYGITLDDFPQTSYANDAYKLWMAKTRYSRGVEMFSGGVTASLGVAQLASGMSNAAGGMTGGSQAAIQGGATQAINGITQMLNVWASVKSAEYLSNRTIRGCANSNILAATERKTIAFYKRTIRYDQAKCIDDFFTMYGYQTNKMKVPNIFSRSGYNFIQTNDANIVAKYAGGGVPNDDLLRIKQMFNDGVTFWGQFTTIGDYSSNYTD